MPDRSTVRSTKHRPKRSPGDSFSTPGGRLWRVTCPHIWNGKKIFYRALEAVQVIFLVAAREGMVITANPPLLRPTAWETASWVCVTSTGIRIPLSACTNLTSPDPAVCREAGEDVLHRHLHRGDRVLVAPTPTLTRCPPHLSPPPDSAGGPLHFSVVTAHGTPSRLATGNGEASGGKGHRTMCQ